MEAKAVTAILTAPGRFIQQGPGAASRKSTLTGSATRRMLICFDSDNNIEVTHDGELPRWFKPTVTALLRTLSLPEGWDTYGARKIDLAFVKAAIKLALDIMDDRTPPPSIVPTSSGGLQLEWHTAGIDLEIEIHSPSRISAAFEDESSNIAWDTEQLDDITTLRDALRKLTQ